MWHEICWEFQNEWNEEHLARRMTRNNLHFSPHRRQLSITCSTFPYYTKLFASSVNVDYEHFPVLSMRGLKTFFPGGLSDNRAKALYLKIASAYTTNALRHSKLSCASRTSELICIQSLSVANNTLPSTTVQKFRCYRQRFCWCNFFSLEDDSLINGSSCNLRWNFFKLISSKPERYFIERVFFLLLIPEREFHSQKPILDPVSQQNRKRRFKFIAGAVEVKRWYAMAQGANFYVLEQIMQQPKIIGKLFKSYLKTRKVLLLRRFREKLLGIGTKLRNKNRLLHLRQPKLCTREIYGLESFVFASLRWVFGRNWILITRARSFPFLRKRFTLGIHKVLMINQRQTKL